MGEKKLQTRLELPQLGFWFVRLYYTFLARRNYKPPVVIFLPDFPRSLRRITASSREKIDTDYRNEISLLSMTTFLSSQQLVTGFYE